MITFAATPVEDVGELLVCIGDYLFDVGVHLRASARQSESMLAIRVGIEHAIRAKFIRITGKIDFPGPPMACLKTLRADGAIDRESYQALAKLCDGIQVRGSQLQRLAQLFHSSSLVDVDYPGPPRSEREAKRIYCGRTLPTVATASFARPKKGMSEVVEA